MNNDGNISVTDVVKILNICNGTTQVQESKIVQGSVEINSETPKETIALKNDSKVTKTGISIYGIFTPTLSANNIMIGDSESNYRTPVLSRNSIKELTFLNGSTPYIQVNTINGNYGITAWVSDKKYKKNIKNSKVNALDVMNKIKHRQFDWKDIDKHEDIGYIATELKKIDENFVIEIKQNDGTSTFQINQNTIISYLTKSVQELSEKNEELEKRIIKLERGKDG